MVVPRPFSKALFVYGPSIEVPRHGDIEEWRATIERAMNELEARADREFDSLWVAARRS